MARLPALVAFPFSLPRDKALAGPGEDLAEELGFPGSCLRTGLCCRAGEGSLEGTGMSVSLELALFLALQQKLDHHLERGRWVFPSRPCPFSTPLAPEVNFHFLETEGFVF